jgi:fatty acid desaturase
MVAADRLATMVPSSNSKDLSMNDFASIARTVFAGRARWIVIAIALVGLAPIAYAHRVPVTPWLPYLMLLACQLAHLFMFHGHGGGDKHERDGARERLRLPPASREATDA